jgi:hypothetical protein
VARIERLQFGTDLGRRIKSLAGGESAEEKAKAHEWMRTYLEKDPSAYPKESLGL